MGLTINFKLEKKQLFIYNNGSGVKVKESG